jgi:putative transposase
MAVSIPNPPRRDSRSFQKTVDAFLGGEGLPFAEVLSSERIERVFQKHGCLFGLHGTYTTAIMVWSFLSQVLRDGKEASCQSAVARVVGSYQLQGLQSPTEDTGAYCRARAKLSSAALRDLSGEVADELQQKAEPKWLWKEKLHAKLVEGMRDTALHRGVLLSLLKGC